MTTIKLKGPGLNDWFAIQAVKDYGPDGARERTCGPARAAVERVIASLPPERECCGTFPRTPHRATCAEYRGKFKPGPVPTALDKVRESAAQLGETIAEWESKFGADRS